MRPAGPLLVACHDRCPWDNATVHVDPMAQYRWDWLKGLPFVVVVMGAETRFGTLLDDILSGAPGQLDVVDTDRAVGWMVLAAKGQLRTVRWPASYVADWLGDQAWHLHLREMREQHGLVAQ
jgi:hypothetical protein